MIISSLRFKNNFVININYKLKVMKHIITSIVLLFITFSVSAQSKEEKKLRKELMKLLKYYRLIKKKL